MKRGHSSIEKLGISLSDSGDYYLRNEMAIAEIIRNVREGHYCAILGPHYREKSWLLKDAKSRLEASGVKVCVLLDLQKLRVIKDGDFLRAFADMVGQSIEQTSGIASPMPANQVADELAIKHFLQDYVQKLEKDLVLLIDHLEVIWTGPLESLL